MSSNWAAARSWRAAATGNYDLPDRLTVEMINLSENATYQASRRRTAAAGRCASTATAIIHRTAIASELAWLIDLRDSGVVITPRPVRGRDGEFIQVVAHPQCAVRAMSCCPNGRPARSPASGEDLSATLRAARRSQRPACICTRGSGSARRGSSGTAGISKRASARRSRIGAAGATAWASTPRRRSCSAGPSISSASRLAAYGQGNDRFGLIHCDLRLANLLIDDGASEGHRFRRLRLRLVHLRCRDAGLVLRARAAGAGADRILEDGLSPRRRACPRPTKTRSPPSSCCAACCWSPGSARIPRPISPNPWASPTRRERSGCARTI